jgi:Flp pilus assembly pilin Flp
MKNQRGQSLVEYIILVALVALVTVSASKQLGSKINGKIQDIKEKIDSGIPVRLSPRE